jgi:hypothetical protein
MYGAIVAKAIIVLVVFPVVMHAIFTAGTVVHGFMLPSLLAVADRWSEVLDKGLVSMTFLAAIGGSFNVCRRLWPTTLAK